MDQHEFYTRYQRQIILKDFDLAAQQKLQAARVLVIGAGGLGCPVLQYLCGAGVGTIGIIDDDMVSLSNLHRQPLFYTEDIGRHKAEVAAERLGKLNPSIELKQYCERLENGNALSIIGSYDIIIDGSDNFPTRYLVNDACVLLDKPFVYGAIAQYQGQLAVFNWSKTGEQYRPVHYRDVFPDQPAEGEVPNCSEAGVLGVLPGIIGTMVAAEAIKMISGIGSVASGQLINYNVLNHEIYRIAVDPDREADALIPRTAAAFYDHVYTETCVTNEPVEIEAALFTQWLNREDILMVDVRNVGEDPAIEGFSFINIPLPEIEKRVGELKHDHIVLFCASGKRSLLAGQALKKLDSTLRVYSLKEGINYWMQINRQIS